MIKYLLIDLDDTLFDFKMCEKVAFVETLENNSIEYKDELYEKFTYYNELYFNEFASGIKTRPEFHYSRFKDTLGDLKNIMDINAYYVEALSRSHVLFDDSVMFLEYVSKKYKLYAATNGMTRVQIQRLEEANILKYFSNIYVSEMIGAHKPEARFFEYIVDDIKDMDKSHYMMIGDRVDADIKGAIDFGIDYILLDRLDNIKNNIYKNKARSLKDCIKFL